MRAVILALILSAGPALAASPGSSLNRFNDYPTSARAEYVFACMNTNGGSAEALRRCSCAIDVIASILPYSQYDQAETVLRMRRMTGGYLAEEFRTAASNAILRSLEEAQAEAEVRCF
ncbi:MAG TPA: hypothetical protein VME92_09440 [Acetobacteraceae bacterium]|nr:hypothetical protein [Acetobacteraceae bacterium]